MSEIDYDFRVSSVVAINEGRVQYLMHKKATESKNETNMFNLAKVEV